MDDFDNFFDRDNDNNDNKTPVYHTPTPEGPKKKGFSVTFAIVVSVVMCLVVLINVVVLASLKNTIAKEYSANIADNMKAQYEAAVKDALEDTDIVEDVKDKAGQL
ncbi:MAG: hypothetical protein IKB54_05725, partial [Clostridia bacterium]|nr:hypothetical protein [Clostridia bacterium]